MKTCAYCKNPIYEFQKFKTKPDKMGKPRHYHEHCFEIVLNKVADKVRRA